MKSNIQILPAKHGDAFILDLWTEDKHVVIVVDSGPYIAGKSIYMRYFDIPVIDLMVITHFDDDHICGIKNYAQKVCVENLDWNVKEMWVNNSKEYPVPLTKELKIEQATTLADTLEKINERYKEFCWKPYIGEGHTKDLGIAKIEVISPPLEFEKYMITRLKNIRQELSDTNEEGQELDPMEISLEKLATRKVHVPNLDLYDELANATSLAFILTCDDFSILMLGDSYPNNIEDYLRKKKKYSEENKLKVDYVKVSHHGSKMNCSTDLYNIIDCDNFIISTNGGIHNHPDREAIAKIVCRSNRTDRTINIFLNYTQENFQNGKKRFIKEGEEEKYNFKVHYNINILPICQ